MTAQHTGALGAEIEALGVDFIVTVNPGCELQLQTGLRLQRSRTRAIHLADLLVRVEDQAAENAGRTA